MTRKRIAFVLLVASVVVWGVWFGGQTFNALMVVPKWGASPPESLRAYNALPTRGGLPFWPLFNPLFVVLAVGAAATAWSSGPRARKWLALSAGCAVAAFVAVVSYLAPLVWRLGRHAADGTLAPEEIAAGVEWWAALNWTRVALELVGFVASAVALSVWSAEDGRAEVGRVGNHGGA